MYPPPITIRFFGTSLSTRAPVEDIIFSSSISMPGNAEGADPVAMTIFLALYDVFF